jgi:hypothetical protein
MALVCHYLPPMSLKVPLETKIVCNFLIISCMLEVKDALEQVVIDPRWNKYVSALFNQQNIHRAHALTNRVRATICNIGFLQQ